MIASGEAWPRKESTSGQWTTLAHPKSARLDGSNTSQNSRAASDYVKDKGLPYFENGTIESALAPATLRTRRG